MKANAGFKGFAGVTLLLVIGTLVAFGDAPPREKWVAPGSASRKANPLPSTPASIKAGKKVFNNNCVSCHGESGKGDGLLAASLPYKPADLDSPEVWRQTDGAIFWKISTGRTPMPTWDPALEDEERWNVINYMRSFFAPAGVGPAAPPPVAVTVPGTTGPATVPLTREATTLPSGETGPVSREEYERMLRDQRAMREEIEQLKKERAAGALPPGQTPAAQSDVDEIDKQIAAIQRDVARDRPGFEGFTLVGDAAINYTATHGSTNTFSAVASPLILWKPYEYLLFETGFDINLNTNTDTTSDSSISLNLADAVFFVNDGLAIGAGEFATPFGAYHNHFDPPWIYKFADDPLPFGDNGIAPGSSLGVFARGAQLIGNSKVTYDLYVSNGPNLITTDPTQAGTLAYDDWSDLNDNKTVGGRLGFIPIPNMEMGYSIMYGKASPPGFPSTHFTLQAVDLNYRPDVVALGGTFFFETEWVFNNVEKVTYDPHGSLGFGPLRYSNYRDGGYAQLTFRPTHESNEIIRNIELCARWDYLKIPEAAPGGGTEQRYTLGVNYWINPQTVLKFDYEIDRRTTDLGPQQSGILIELGLGL